MSLTLSQCEQLFTPPAPATVSCEEFSFGSKKRLAPLITICTLIPSLLMLFVDFVAFRFRKEKMRAEQKRLHIAPNSDLDIDLNHLTKKRQRLPSLRLKSTFETLDPHHIRPDFSRTSSASDLAAVPNHPYEDIMSTSSGKTPSSIYPAAPPIRSKSSRVDSILPLKIKGMDKKRALSALPESESSYRH
ncbi:uncharacterized protein LOC131928398 isoform X2 [Physella acuta]|uniref:uncharacterized protein LOC131928398 isoform X2 n=1 Tax=Physella acuta TaxID=109671 RepID=UPI0027DC99D6|nr:uncharacterized protein LOC131928398 isoform X2 [Physella acuta]